MNIAINSSILRKSEHRNSIDRIIMPETEGGSPLLPDAGFISDRHPFFEILINLEGFCEYPLNDTLYSLRPGTAVLIPPWCRHSYGYRSCDTGLLHLWIHFQTAYHGSVLRIHNGSWRSCPDLSFCASVELCRLFLVRWEQWKKNGEKGMEMLFFQNILNSFLDEMKLQEKHHLQTPERDIVTESLTMIRNMNGRDCSLDFLARQVRTSKYHLAHRIREATGRTVGSFIEEARRHYVESAREHGLSFKEIAWNLGFSSAASFSNWYHKHYTVSKSKTDK